MGAQAGALSLLRCDGQGHSPAAGAARRPATRRKVPVTVHVYDIGTAIGLVNKVLRKLDTGVYHCGVEIYGIEWGFCDTANPDNTGSGVFTCAPGDCVGFQYRESMRMGTSAVLDANFDRLIREFQRVWQASEYDLLTCNCIHFASRLLSSLGVAPLPHWVRSSSLAAERLDAGCTPTGRAIFCCAESPAGVQEVHPLVEMVPAAPFPRDFGGDAEALRGSSTPTPPPRRPSTPPPRAPPRASTPLAPGARPAGPPAPAQAVTSGSPPALRHL